MEETRASKKQRTEPKHALEVLPGSAWRIIGKHVYPYDRHAFGLTCKTFYEAVTRTEKEAEKKKKDLALRTDLSDKRLFEETPSFSLDWFQWVLRSFERKKVKPKPE